MEKKTFRDKLGIVSDEGKRLWVYAKKPSGKLYNYRLISGLFLSFLFFLLPHIRINDSPLFLFDVIERKFVLFTVAFWPQDFLVFFLIMISSIIFLVLFTVVYGRIFCGWGCPQSIFMEIVFRNIEYAIEGNYQNQKRMSNDFSGSIFLRKLIKHIVFWILSFLIATTIIAYIGGSDAALDIAFGKSGSNGKFLGLAVFATVIYLIFSQLRELVCTVICPYGRLQGVLLDKHSVCVSYDYKRGEPRGTKAADNGDCVDCINCVLVCPAGIDIRNGIQLECTNCTACIDACNSVMVKAGKPKGLIRYASLESIENGTKLKFTNRMKGYTGVLIFLLGLLFYLLLSRTDIRTTIIRTPGTLFQTLETGEISNMYNIKVINKQSKESKVVIKLKEESGRVKNIGDSVFLLKPNATYDALIMVILPKPAGGDKHKKIKLEVYNDNILVEVKQTEFFYSN